MHKLQLFCYRPRAAKQAEQGDKKLGEHVQGFNRLILVYTPPNIYLLGGVGLREALPVSHSLQCFLALSMR